MSSPFVAHVPQTLNNERLSTEHHGPNLSMEQDEADKNEERLSASKLKRHADTLISLLDCAKWAETRAWQPFMRDLEALAEGMDKLAAAMVKNTEAVRAARAAKEPPHAPDREEDVKDSRVEEPCASDACAIKYATLRSRLAKLGDYELLVLDDNIMGVSASSTANVKKHVRRAFIDDLAIPEAAVYIHIFRSGGPRPSTIHVWKEPSDEAKRSVGKQAAAVAQAVAHAPRTATRQMMHDFFNEYTATKLPVAVLRSLWDGISGSTRERDARQEVIDDRVLQWMADEGVTDEETFWDMRSLNGADGHRFDAFWDELGAYLELEMGAGAHERRAAEADDVMYASKVISIPQMIRDVAELLHAKEGFKDSPIPSESCVIVQFMPNRPTALRSARFTMRFRFIRKVQPRIRDMHCAHDCVHSYRFCTACFTVTDTVALSCHPHCAAGADAMLAQGARGCSVLPRTRSQL